MPGTHRERPDPPRAAELVRRYRDHRRPHPGEIEFPRRVHRVGVKGHPGTIGDLGDLLDRLDRAGLVIGVHDRDQHGLWTHRRGDIGCGDVAVGPRIDDGQLDAEFGKRTSVLQDRGMLDGGGDQMPGEPAGGEGSPQRSGVGFAATRGQHDFIRGDAKQTGDGSAGGPESVGGHPARLVIAGGVADHTLADRHRRGSGREQRGGRRVIQIHRLRRHLSRRSPGNRR